MDCDVRDVDNIHGDGMDLDDTEGKIDNVDDVDD